MARSSSLSKGRLGDVVELLGALILGTLVAVVGLKVIGAVGWPAYNTSNVTRALTTLGQALAVAVGVVAFVLAYYGKARLVSAWLGAVSSAALATVTLGMPLGATRLYLHGLSSDQQFRTEYLTRLASSPRLADMTYVDLPPFYPATWFWLGGRYADLAGIPGWEAYKPWSIISLAAAAALGTALWIRMSGVGIGTAVGLAVTAVTLQYGAAEPYAAVLVLIGVPMLVVIAYALRGRSRFGDGPTPLAETSWIAVIAGGVFLGVSATVYTLYTGLFAGTAVLMALVYLVLAFAAYRNKAIDDDVQRAQRRSAITGVVVRIAVMGVIALVVAAVFWLPYFLHSGPRSSAGAAEHYLPERGAIIPMPFFQFSLIGALTLIGLVWVLVRFRHRTIAFAFAVTLVGVLGMTLASLARTAIGSTLLSFRLETITAGVLATAGVFGVVQLGRIAVDKFGDVRTAVGVLAAVAAVAAAQQIPSHLSTDITMAYTDTDGAGERADHRPPGAESYYAELHKQIREQTGRKATDNVVLTADYSFLSVYPYWGFQGLTSHYANPLAEFEQRAATIEKWSDATTPQQLKDQMAAAPWRAPDVFVFRYSPDGYTLRLAQDVYPNDPNVKRYTVTFDPAVFADPAYRVTEIGPFVLVVRQG